MVIKENRSGLELKFFELSKNVLSSLDLELYDLEWTPHSGNLTVFVVDPKTGTALIDDCIRVDRAMTPFIETETWMPENLTLEVSSPGLYRNLSSIEHFVGVKGQDVMLTLLKKIDENQSVDFPKALRNNLKIKVKLIDADNEKIIVDAKGVQATIPYSQIKKANLETEINYKTKE